MQKKNVYLVIDGETKDLSFANLPRIPNTRGLRAPYVHKSLCFPKSQGHNMVIFQEYQIFNFFSSQFAYNFLTYFLEGKILKSYMKSLRM